MYTPDPERWAFGQNEDVQELIQEQARVVQQMHAIVCSPFRRENAGDEKRALEGYAPIVLDDLEQLRPDASENYWRAITPVYIRFLQHDCEDRGYLPNSLLEDALRAAIGAYDATVLPYRNQNVARIEFVRGQLYARLRKAMNIIKETPSQEEDDGE